MRQTLFFIPDELWGYPLFGFGWLLALWIVGSAIALGYYVSKQGWNNDTLGMLPFIGLVAAAIGIVMPAVAVDVAPHEAHAMLWQPSDAQATPSGLPIRGYGMCLLVATVSGVALATYRAKKVGLSPDAIFGLAFHMFVAGIVGARLFFIIQKWNESIYDPNSLANTLKNCVNFVEGGLVVYGSLIGALIGAIYFLRKHKLPLLPVADLIAPSLPLGLAIGRIGCLMNGCCFGGVCEQPWAITFPEHSPPYEVQQRNGEFFGFRLKENEQKQVFVQSVKAGSSAEQAGLTSGMRVDRVLGYEVRELLDAQRALASFSGANFQLTADGKPHRFAVDELPVRSLPTHPTQLYSSINAFLLCLLAIAYYPFRRNDGEVFALLIGCYAVTRFLLEVIRTDESGIWNTGLTISQNVSVMMLIGVAGLVAYIAMRRDSPVQKTFA